jgi:hypothetical protein
MGQFKAPPPPPPKDSFHTDFSSPHVYQLLCNYMFLKRRPLNVSMLKTLKQKLEACSWTPWLGTAAHPCGCGRQHESDKAVPSLRSSQWTSSMSVSGQHITAVWWRQIKRHVSSFRSFSGFRVHILWYFCTERCGSIIICGVFLHITWQVLDREYMGHVLCNTLLSKYRTFVKRNTVFKRNTSLGIPVSAGFTVCTLRLR